MEQIQELFAQYPAIDTFHVTSDGQAFTQKQDAVNHASTLEDKAVKTVEREKKAAEVVTEVEVQGDIAAEEVKVEKEAVKPAKVEVIA